MGTTAAVVFSTTFILISHGLVTDYDIDSNNSAWKLRTPPISKGEFINSGTPGGAPLSFDCSGRYYAWQYGKQIQPRHGDFVELFDALQLAACNYTRPLPPKRRKFPTYTTRIGLECEFYISAEFGSDSNDGSLQSPFASIIRGIEATRNVRANGKLMASTTQCTLNLMEGTYFQNGTIVLTAADSYLTFQNYNGQHAVISGGVPLQFSGAWNLEEYKPTQWVKYPNYNNVANIAGQGYSNDQCKFSISHSSLHADCYYTIHNNRYLGVQVSYQQCVEVAGASLLGPFYSVSWYNSSYPGWQGHCYGLKDKHWGPVQDDGVESGNYEGRNIWSIQVSNTNDLLDGKIYGLRVDKERAIRARYPNQNPETSMQYAPLSGWILATTKWVPPVQVENAIDVVNTAANWPGVIWPMNGPGNTTWTGEGDWGEFYQAYGGPCANLEPDYGYWCGHDAPRHITQHEAPSGVYITPDSVINAPYSDVSDAVVHAWRPSHWYTWMWTAGAYNRSSGKLTFADGGFQGGEGETVGAEWYIENVFDELDFPGEYFYNSSTQTLYYYYNTTTETAPPMDTEFVAVRTKILFNITGTQANPVRNITFQGLEFRDTPYTYMDKHGLPSGGDWAIQRQGAITFEGTELCLINECYFTRLDGIGIFLSGYNRNTTIENNEFSWIGDSSIASWGYTTGIDDKLPGGGPDGREGNQPRFSMIRNNMVHELGIWEKQSSMWFQATSAQTRIINNVFFNGPRAAVNTNDGFGGDNHMIGNLLMNTCRESGDHGPWNSWDRVPYITNIGNGSSSIIPAYQQIHNNFIIGTYQTQEGIDTDDGSSYYNTHDNFFMYGSFGLKNDFGGHDNHHTNNVYAFITDAWTFCCISGANDIFANNSVILTNNAGYNSNCELPEGTAGMIVEYNNVYTPSGLINGNGIVCNMTFAEWQAKGNDPGTTVTSIPSDEEIIAMAKKLLNNN